MLEVLDRKLIIFLGQLESKVKTSHQPTSRYLSQSLRTVGLPVPEALVCETLGLDTVKYPGLRVPRGGARRAETAGAGAESGRFGLRSRVRVRPESGGPKLGEFGLHYIPGQPVWSVF